MALSSRSFRTLVTLCLVTRPDAVWPPAQILGKGWDLTNSNFWEYAESFHANMFSHRMPPRSCFTDTRCLHVSSQLHQSFKSVQEWERYCTRTLGLQREHDGRYLASSVAASFGRSHLSNWTDERNSLFVKLTNRRKCFKMSNKCLWNPDYLHPAVKRVMSSLPLVPDEESIKAWEQEFIMRFGTHVNVGSEHGSEIKILSSMSTQCQSSSKCLQTSLCDSVSWLKYGDPAFCEGTSECDTTSQCRSLRTQECIIAGGKPDNGISLLCSSDTTDDDLDTFMIAGNDTAGSSAIRYIFKPTYEILNFMGYRKEFKMLRMASEYHSCVAPRYRWSLQDDGDWRCECNLDCGDGGTLDRDGCTCHCKGDLKHGFFGSSCERWYGQCQAGIGTLHHKAAGRCAEHGVCQNLFHTYSCSPTEVCCLSRSQGTCCPMDHRCQCSSTMCSCVPLSKGQNAAISHLV